jgi:hypothetical protein
MFAALTGDRPHRQPILDAMHKLKHVADTPYRGPTFVPTQAMADRLSQVYGGTLFEVLPAVLPRLPTSDRTCTYCGREGHRAASCPWRPA